MPGHLFVTRGDIRNLGCSAWLLPTDLYGQINPVWTTGDERLAQAVGRDQHRRAIEEAGWHRGSSRVARLMGRDGLWPAVWVGALGAHEGEKPAWYVAGICEFVDAAAGEVVFPSTSQRDRPLLAIPLVGTLEGGQARRKGEMAQAIVAGLGDFLASRQVDVVLVTRGEVALAAAQWARREAWADDWHERWSGALDGGPEKGADLVELAGRLAARARARTLVAFVGAGVGAAAGLPQWDELIDRLAVAAKIDPDEVRDLDLLDRAHVIRDSLAAENPPREIGDEVCTALPAGPSSLAHTLLATMPIYEFVTTNYDERLERAAEEAERRLSVLQYRPLAGGERWLLKLHGSVTHPRDIVLTRTDYLEYGQRRAALRGIVQAMLMTRHMLFVGFGLSDDNFHRIAHDVQLAIRDRGPESGAKEPFATALLVRDRPLFDRLWGGDIQGVALGEASADAVAAGARRVEVLLDLVAAESTTATAHLMDPAYSALLSPDERQLRDALKSLWKGRPEGPSPAWERVEHLLREFGLGDDSSPT
jgi:hypothetical protein